jgi:serpin B
MLNRSLSIFLLSTTLVSGQDLVPGINKFAAESYRKLGGSGGNFVASPFSIHNALSMALAGARNETATEMAAVLQQTYPNATYHEEFAALLAKLKESANPEQGTQLTNAANLWVEQSFQLEPDFQNTLQTQYGAPLSQLDFLSNAEGARQTINSWTEEQTNGKIRDLFAEGSLDDKTRLVLTTAIYFMGKWQIPFVKERTIPGAFQSGEGEPATANFMNQTARVGYAETPVLQLVEMKYAGSDTVFDILLPKSPATLADLENEMSGENLAALFSTIETKTVELAIPKFRIESGGSVRDSLVAMGMPTAFTEAADFSGIDGQKDLLITDVVHKAFIDVNEDGTEAAAATGVSIGVTSVPIVQHTFRADHPFAFVLRDTRTGVILFSGRFSTPQ